MRVTTTGWSGPLAGGSFVVGIAGAMALSDARIRDRAPMSQPFSGTSPGTPGRRG